MFTTRPELAGTFGMVASTHWLASAAGMAELEAGGNAFDAAAAVGFALQVVEPHLNGPGGDMPLLFATAASARPTVLCGQGPAPAAATVGHFRDLGMPMIPGAGPLAAAVPGATDAWLTLLRDHGTRTLADVLSYAIGYAEGHPLVSRVVTTIGTVAELFRTDWTTSAEVYLPDGRPPEPGALFANPALARTYRRLVEAERAAPGGRDAGVDAALAAWREGFVAEAVDQFTRQPYRDSSGERHAGLVTGADLAAFRATYEEPATGSFRDVQVCKTGAWGQGPVLLQQLALLDGFDDRTLAVDTADGVHTVVECAKLAFADREAWYGDVPDVPLDALLSRDYADSRRGLVTDEASYQLRPGSPDGREPRLPRHLTEGLADLVSAQSGAGVGEPTVDRSGGTRGDTCHVDVVDRWGNLVSATPSGGWLQSSPVIPELGFPLGSRLQMCWLEEGLPASLAPGRRPRTTLSPTLVLRDGVPVMACGTPGGDQQDQWQVVFLLAHLIGGLNLQEAIDAPSWHTNAVPSSFYPRGSVPGEVAIEDRMPTEVTDELIRRGHRVTRTDPWFLGRLSAVSRDPGSGILRAAANPRGMQGYAIGR